MDMQVAKNASVPIPHGQFLQNKRSGAESGNDALQQARNGIGNTVIQSLKQLEFAEINGKKVTIGEEQLVRAIERALKEMIGPTTELEVKIHEQTRSVVMRVMNQDTGELIWEVPPEKTLDIVYKMMEIAGLLFDEKV